MADDKPAEKDDKKIDKKEDKAVEKKTDSKPAAKKESKPKKATKKVVKWVAIVGAVIVGLIVALVIYVLLATSGAAKVSDDFLVYMQSSNGAEAYALFSTEAMEATSEDDFNAAIERIAPILNGEPRSISKEIEKTDDVTKATISYEIDGSDEVTYVVTFELIETDDGWKILNFNSVGKQ